jgi:tetratricopeptide (TPR) repeat protein
MADALNNLALVSGDQGDYIASLDYLKEALEIKRGLGDVNGEAIALGNLGTLYAFLGMFPQAEEALALGSDLSMELGNRENAGHSVSNRAGLYNLMERFEEAVAEAEEGVKLTQSTGDAFTESYAHEFLGLALEGLEKLGEAEAAFRKALQIRRGFGLHEVIYLALARLAWNLAQQGRGEEALTVLAEMEEMDEAGVVKNVRMAQTGCWNTYRVLTQIGDARAGEYLERAAAHVREQSEGILDEGLRKSFLENVPDQREILAESS